MAKVTESGVSRLSSVSSTIMQSLTFITFMVSELMTNNTSGINTEIKVTGQKLETVTSFKYPGSVVSDEGSKPERLSRIA